MTRRPHSETIRGPRVQTDLRLSCFVGTVTLLSPGRPLPASKHGLWLRSSVRTVESQIAPASTDMLLQARSVSPPWNADIGALCPLLQGR